MSSSARRNRHAAPVTDVGREQVAEVVGAVGAVGPVRLAQDRRRRADDPHVAVGQHRPGALEGVDEDRELVGSPDVVLVARRDDHGIRGHAGEQALERAPGAAAPRRRPRARASDRRTSCASSEASWRRSSAGSGRCMARQTATVAPRHRGGRSAAEGGEEVGPAIPPRGHRPARADRARRAPRPRGRRGPRRTTRGGGGSPEPTSRCRSCRSARRHAGRPSVPCVTTPRMSDRSRPRTAPTPPAPRPAGRCSRAAARASARRQPRATPAICSGLARMRAWPIIAAARSTRSTPAGPGWRRPSAGARPCGRGRSRAPCRAGPSAGRRPRGSRTRCCTTARSPG